MTVRTAGVQAATGSGTFTSQTAVRTDQARASAEGVAAAEAAPPQAAPAQAKALPRMTISEPKQGPGGEQVGWQAAEDNRPYGRQTSPVLAAALENATPEQGRLAGFMAEAQARQRKSQEDRPFMRMGGAVL